MIHEVTYTIQCDHPGCENRVSFSIAPGQTIMGQLRARGWQPWQMFDFCPEHHKED
jgi:hypothetical protein